MSRSHAMMFRAVYALLAAFFVASALVPEWAAAEATGLNYLAGLLHAPVNGGAPPQGLFWGAAVYMALMSLGN